MATFPILKVKDSYHESGKRYVDIQVVPMHSIATRRESDVSDLSRGRIFEPMYLLGWKPEDPTPPELDEEKLAELVTRNSMIGTGMALNPDELET